METHDILTDLEWMMVMAALEDDVETEDEFGDEECDEAGDVLQTSSSFQRLMMKERVSIDLRLQDVRELWRV